MRREAKQEASMSVQSRINATILAELDKYWMSEDKSIKTLSQLVSWSMELLSEILSANRKIKRRIESVAEARNYLLSRGLCQHSLHDRGITKMGKAIMFENMREEGANPEICATRQYKSLHRVPEENGKPSTVEPFTGKVDSELVKKALEIHSSLDSADVVPRISQEFKMRDKEEERVVKNEDAAEFVRAQRERVELPPLKEKGNSKELIQKRIQAADEESKEMLDELNSFDPMSLIGKAVKERSLND
jgi:hypothetical protein